MAGKEKREKARTVELTQSAFALMIILSLGGLLFVYNLSKESLAKKESAPLVKEKVVEVGDTVMVNYVGRFLNETVFDTSMKEVALASGIYKIDDAYNPVTFKVGEGRILKGIDEGVVGVKEGGKKVIIITPEKGYGEYNPMLIQQAPRTYPVDRASTLPLTQFSSVVSSEPKPDTTIIDPNVPWPMFIQNVSNDSVSFLYSPEVGSQFETFLGLADVVNVTEDKIWIRENPVVDSMVVTRAGAAKVVEFNETTVVLDYNHPLAGKSFTYEVTVEGIFKEKRA